VVVAGFAEDDAQNGIGIADAPWSQLGGGPVAISVRQYVRAEGEDARIFTSAKMRLIAGQRRQTCTRLNGGRRNHGGGLAARAAELGMAKNRACM